MGAAISVLYYDGINSSNFGLFDCCKSSWDTLDADYKSGFQKVLKDVGLVTVHGYSYSSVESDGIAIAMAESESYDKNVIHMYYTCGSLCVLSGRSVL